MRGTNATSLATNLLLAHDSSVIPVSSTIQTRVVALAVTLVARSPASRS
jgi:hypothetical protein